MSPEHEIVAAVYLLGRPTERDLLSGKYPFGTGNTGGRNELRRSLAWLVEQGYLERRREGKALRYSVGRHMPEDAERPLPGEVAVQIQASEKLTAFPDYVAARMGLAGLVAQVTG